MDKSKPEDSRRENNHQMEVNSTAHSLTIKMLTLLAIAIATLLIIAGFFINTPEQPMFEVMIKNTNVIPSNLSSINPQLSKILDMYCKSAPILALAFFLFARQYLIIQKTQGLRVLIKTLLAFTILYFIIIYYLLLHSSVLNESGALLRFLSSNDYLLTLFFICVYSACYVLSVYYFSFVYAVVKLTRNR